MTTAEQVDLSDSALDAVESALKMGLMQDTSRAADLLHALRARLRDLDMERKARNAMDPVTRLHNICDAMSEDRAESPYSQEAWDLQDAAYQEKCKECNELRAALARAEARADGIEELMVNDREEYRAMPKRIEELEAALARAEQERDKLAKDYVDVSAACGCAEQERDALKADIDFFKMHGFWPARS